MSPPDLIVDVFISHASEDKDEIARPLAEALKSQGLTVWYDEYVLRLGDSLRQTIDRGLSSARFGIVILTPAFFSKEWPQRELNGLLAREISNGAKVLLPVWHKVTADDVARFSPPLADKWAVSTDKGFDVVVGKVLEVIKPVNAGTSLQSPSPHRGILTSSSKASSLSSSEPFAKTASSRTIPISSFKPRCYLSYTIAYGTLLESMRRLLEVLEFEVDIFDGPDLLQPALSSFQNRIDSADAVLVFLGPGSQINNGDGSPEPARWVEEELIYATALDKPLAIFCHSATFLSELVDHGDYNTVEFDFWDANSFLNSIPQIVGALQDLKRRCQLPSGSAPFVFTKSIVRTEIEISSIALCIYQEVIARRAWDSFSHVIDTGLDKSENARIKLLTEIVELKSFGGGTHHAAELKLGRQTGNQLEYSVELKPGLKAGERFGYRREFILQNWFPLTKPDLEARASKPGFPSIYRANGTLSYGDTYDVLFEMDSISLELQFPVSVRIAGIRANGVVKSSPIHKPPRD